MKPTCHENPSSVQISNKTKEIIQEINTYKEKETPTDSGPPINIPTTIAMKDDETERDESDEDEDELFDLAQKWAESKEKEARVDVEKGKRHNRKKDMDRELTVKTDTPQTSISSPSTKIHMHQTDRKKSVNDNQKGNKFSLHITNLPYNATKAEILEVFVNNGCKVNSLRLVYNYHTSRRDVDKKGKNIKNNNHFTGVAFADMADETSFNLGLKMDKTMWGQKGEENNDSQHYGRGWKRRRINVRPTKTKEELAQIVAQTRERLAAHRQERKDASIHAQTPSKGKKKDSLKGGKKEAKDNSVAKNKELSGSKRKRNDESGDSPSKRKKAENRKLTKRERAKKAAILRTKISK